MSLEKRGETIINILGEKVEANAKIGVKWKGINGFKSKFTFRGKGLIAVTGQKWTELRLDGKIGKSGLILDEKSIEESNFEGFEDMDEFVNGAVIRLNETFYAKIVLNKVIFYLIKNKRWFKTSPIPVFKSQLNFPPNINAAFESIDGYFYFIRSDKYCKRRLKDKFGVSLDVIPSGGNHF